MVTFVYIFILPAVIAGLICYYFKRKYNYWKSRGVPYKPVSFPFGNLLDVIRGKDQLGKFIAKLYNECKGPYIGFYGFTKPYLIIKDPDLIRRILIKDFHVFPNRGFVCEGKIDPVMSYSLIGIKSPHWKALRNKLSPVFTTKKMKMMMPLIKQCGENFKIHLATVLNKNVDAKELASKYTTDVITSCAFGIDANSFADEMKIVKQRRPPLIFSAKLTSLAYIFAPLAVKIFKFKFFELGDYLQKIFSDTIKQRETSKIQRNDLVDILIDLKNQETADDKFKFYGDRLVAQAIMFFVAGHETSSSTISFTLHELAVHADIQDRVRKEIENVIQSHGDLNYEAMQDMKYLQMIISETLRKYPLTPFLHRECIEDYKIPETGLVLEQGTLVIVPQHGLHWDAQHFPNPEKYDPERFNDDNKHKITPYVYLPFGDGPRNCIGERFALMNSKLGLIYILRNFQIVRCSETKEPLIFQPTSLLRAKGGVKVALQKLRY